jgi:hypothetical protein
VSTFQETLDKHLGAIHQRDFVSLEQTIASGDIVLITSDGKLIRDRETFLNMHREWFGSKAWRMGVEPVSQWESRDLGVVVLKLDYREEVAGTPGVRAESFLTLVFQRQGDRWVMVQDQNTPCKAADA